MPLRPKEPLHPPDAEQAVALLALQARVAEPPAATADGAALSVTTGSGRMLTDALTGGVVPPGPTQVRE